MKKEFNLSEKIIKETEWSKGHFGRDDVKEFIKRLKEIKKPIFVANSDWNDVLKEIDKLAGDKLT